jgi:hypothetical protein
MKSYRTAVLGALALFVVSLAGCSLTIEEREVFARPDVERDELHLLLLYRGVTASGQGEADVEKALGDVIPVLEGRRRFDVSHWGGHDLDDPDLVAELSSGDELDVETLSFLDGITVAETGSWIDEAGRLCGYQVIRIKNLSRGLGLLNAGISRLVRDWSREDDFLEETGPLDDRSRELLVRAAENGYPWLRLEAADIVLRIPITSGSVERVQRVLIDGLAEGHDADIHRWIVDHLMHVREYRVEKEEVIFRFTAPVTGAYRLCSPTIGAEAGGSLVEGLRERGFEPAGPFREEAIVSSFLAREKRQR